MQLRLLLGPIFTTPGVSYNAVLKIGSKKKGDRQCTYKTTFRDIRVTIVAVENQEVQYYILSVCL